MRINGLIENWLANAPLFREHGQEGIAVAYERCAEDLRDALRTEEEEILTIKQAASETGYSEGHLRRLVGDGKIPNAGRKGSPKIARRDLPGRKAAVDRDFDILHFDAEQIVRSAIDFGDR